MEKYQDIVIDNDGNAILGATITVTDSGGGVSTIYSDDGITEKANPFTASSVDGAYSFYAANGRYDITITKTGFITEQLTDIVFYDEDDAVSSFMQTVLDDTDAAAAQITLSAKGVIDTITNLKAETNITNGRAIFLTDGDRGGPFVFDTTDHSTATGTGYVDADTQNGIYVPPDSDSTGASGAWVRRFSGPVNVKWFGAKGDSSFVPGTPSSYATGTDCTDAVTGAIAYLENTTTIQKDGGWLYFPKGHYRFDAQTINTRLVLTGDGAVSRIAPNNNENTDFLTFTTDVHIEEIFIDGNEDNQTAGAALKLQSADFFKLRNVSIYHGKDYNVSISGGNQGVLDGCKILSSSGYGVRTANHMVLNLVNGTTIEDNATGGLLVAGSSTSASVMVDGCYFENNDTSAAGSYHIECTNFQSQALGNTASHFISVRNSYFNGSASSSTQKCFYFSGTGLDNNTIKNNFLINMSGTIWTFDSITSAEVGFNDISENIYGTGVATPAISQHGFFYDTSRRVNLKSDEHDAAVATVRNVLLPNANADTLIGRVTNLSITYTAASNGSETGTIGVGTEGANSSIYTGNISTTAAARDSFDLTGSLVTDVIEDLTAPSQLLTTNFTAGGAAKFVIYMDAIIW
jgi:hypothetical protein